MDPDALFVYGTLQFPDVLRALIDRIPDASSATAHGWRVAALPGQVYPGLVPADAGTAQGLLMTGLTTEEWQTIDAFEAIGYDLRRLELDNNRRGWAYVCAPHIEASPQDWSAEEFARQHLHAYIANCAVWRRRHQIDDQAI